MKRTTILLALLLLPLVTGINATITIEAPDNVIPGETFTISTYTEIDGVRVISLPTTMTITRPDGTRSDIPLYSTTEGTYTGTTYTPLTGTYTLTATATINEEQHIQQQELFAGKPPYTGTITTNGTHITINNNQNTTYNIHVLRPSPGTLDDQNVQDTCTTTCDTCTLTCDVGNAIAWTTLPEAYTQDIITTKTVLPEQLVTPGTIINTTNAYSFDGNALTALGPTTKLTEDTLIIHNKEAIATQQYRTTGTEITTINNTLAYNPRTGTWSIIVDQELYGQVLLQVGEDTIRSATSIDGKPLSHTTNTVLAAGPFEAIIETTKERPTTPSTITTDYGAVITGAWETPFRLGTNHHSGYTVHNPPGTDASIPFMHGTNENIYTIQEDHVLLAATQQPVIQNTDATRYNVIHTGSTHTLAIPDTQQLLVLDQSLAIKQTRDLTALPTSTWTATLPAGRYYLLASTTEETYVTPVQIVSNGTRFDITPGMTYDAKRNTQITVKHTITNLDSNKPQTIDIALDTPYNTLLYDAKGNRLTDTNLNGLPDTGLMGAGAQKTIHAQVFIPETAESTNITWTASNKDTTLTVQDAINIESVASLLASNDVAITRMELAGRAAQITYFNYDNIPKTVETNLVYLTNNGEDTSQHSITLPPGITTEYYPLPTATTMLHAKIILNDEDTRNNERTLIVAAKNGLTLHASEQLHTHHDAYHIKATVPKGEYTAFYPTTDGSFNNAYINTISSGDETQTIIVTFPLRANTDFTVTLLPGAAESTTIYDVIDNRDSRVSQQGIWYTSSQVPGYYGPDYLHDLDQEKGRKSVSIQAADTPGYYELETTHPGDSIFASNTKLVVGEQTITLDQRRGNQWKYLGRYWLDNNTPITISNEATDGQVVIDAFRTLRVDQYANAQEKTPTPSTNITLPDEARFLLYNSRGEEVLANIDLKKNGRLIKGGLLPSQARANKGLHEITFRFSKGPVQQLIVHAADPATMRLGIESVPVERVQDDFDVKVRDAFAINPGFSSDYTITRVAQGTALYKCTEYDFDTQTCAGDYTKVRDLTRGEVYTHTYTPGDPINVEVDDEIIPPIAAYCSNGGTYDESNCQGAYDTTPTCDNEHLYCNDTNNNETVSAGRNTNIGVVANYSDVNRDPSTECDTIQDVFIEYRVWESGDPGLVYEINVDPNGTGWTVVVATTAAPDTMPATYTVLNVTGDASWSCSDFFGPDATARVWVVGNRSGGDPADVYVLEVDYLVYRVNYNYTQYPLETSASSYPQGTTVAITGSEIWQNGSIVIMNITKDGSYIDQVNATANITNEFTAYYNITDYAALGSYDIYAYQNNDSSINDTVNYTVTKRIPTIKTNIVGDFFNRSQTVKFNGTAWGKGVNVSVTASDPENDPLTLTPSRNETNTDGAFTYYWTIPSNLGGLTGTFTFNFTETLNATYNATKSINVVVLPSAATDDAAQNELSDINKRDNIDADFINSVKTTTQWLQVDFPPTVPSGNISIYDLTLYYYHQEDATAAELEIEWYNLSSLAWEVACVETPTTVRSWDTCNLTSFVNQSEYYNNISVRFTDGNDQTPWPATPVYKVDIAYLRPDWAYPPPTVMLESPDNNTWFGTENQTLSFNVSHDFLGINWCRLYVNGVQEYENSSIAVNTSDTYTHTFTEGNHSWNVSCQDDSPKNRVGYSETRQILIDLTPPESKILYPATNYTWTNDNTPEINFTANDTLDLLLNYSVWVNGTRDQNGTLTNGSIASVNLGAQADGLKTVVVEVWDEVYHYATNKTVYLYVDSTPPYVALNNPVEEYNASNNNVTFNWSAIDNLDPYMSCDILINDLVNTTGIGTVNDSSNSTTINNFVEGNYNWSVRCTDETGGYNYSAETRNFTVDNTPPNVSLESPGNKSVFITTRNVQLDYNVTDALLDVQSCTLYINNESNQTNNTITEGTTQSFWLNNNSIGVYDWNVECTDYAGNRENSSQYWFEIRVSVIVDAPSNATRYDRDSFNADPDVVLFIANTSDGASGELIQFYMNLTQPFIQNNIFIGQNTTNASGTTTWSWNPNTTTYAGNYTWWGRSAKYYNDTSNFLYVYGTPSIDFQHPALDPDAEYNATQTVRLNASVQAPAENATTLNQTYVLRVNATITMANSSNVSRILTGVGNLTNTYTIPGEPSIGVWTVKYVTLADWFYVNDTNNTPRNFTVRGPANLVNPPNGSVIDRDGVAADDDTARLVAYIPKAVAGYNVSFYASLTSPSFGDTNILLGWNDTNASGHATYNYNPDSTRYAGSYTWWAESNISYINQTRTFIIKGSLDVNRSLSTAFPAPGYNQSDTAAFWMNVSNGAGKETQAELGNNYSLTTNVTFTHNLTGTPYYTPSLLFNGENWTGTQAIGLTDTVGVYKVIGNSSGPYQYERESPTYYVTVYGLSSLFLADDTDSVVRRVFDLVNFTANYSDTRNDSINYTNTYCEIRFNLTSGWTSYQNMTYHEPSGLYWYNRTFNDTYEEAASNVHCDDPLYEARNTTSNFTINRTKTYLWTGPGTIIDRDETAADADVLYLNASIPNATAGFNIEFYTNLTHPALGQTQVFIGNNTTDSNGYAGYYWNPNNTFYAGNHTVYANNSFADVGNTTHVLLYAQLQSVFYSATTDPASSYTINESAIVAANATTVGPETTDHLHNNYSAAYNAFFASSAGQDSAALSYVNPYWNGTYTLLTLGGVGIWNVSANTTADYHYRNGTNRTFTVYGYMNVTDNTVSPNNHYVYGYATDYCTVRDQHSDANVSGAVVSFYRNGTFLGSNTTNTSGIATISFQTNVSGSYQVRCNVSDQPGIYYLAGDEEEMNDTLTVLPFPITPVNPTNDTQVDRDGQSGAVTDVVSLNVSVPAYVPDNVVITFFSDLTDPTSSGPYTLGSNVTNNSYAVLYYNPNSSSLAGNHSWYGTATSGVSNGSRSYLSIGGLNLSFWDNDTYPGLTMTQNDTLWSRFNLTSLGPETRNSLNSSYLGVVNFSLFSVNGVDSNDTSYVNPFWAGSYSLLGLAGVGVWNITGNSSADYFFGDDVTGRNFTVYGYMNVTDNTVTPGSVYTYQWTTDTCTVRDQHTDATVSGAVVSFYRNSTLLGSNTTNASGTATVSFQTNVSGIYQVRCNVSDQPGIYYLAGDEEEMNDTLTVLPFPVTPANPVNDTQVDRDGVSGSVDDVIILNVSVPSFIPDNVPITFYSNVTDPVTGGPYTLGSNDTNNSRAILYYNPNSSSYAGNHSWWGTNPNAYSNGSRTYTSIGGLTLLFWDNDTYPALTYNQNDSVDVRFNLTSLGPETRNELNNSYLGSVNYSLFSVNGVASNTTSYVNPFWAGSYSLLGLAGVGVWNVSGNSSADYFFGDDVTGRNFTVYGYMNVTENTLSSNPIYAYEWTTDSCTVRDQHTNVNVTGAVVSFYRNGTFLGSNSTNAIGVATVSFQTNVSGTYQVRCNVSDQPGIYYLAGDEEEMNDTLTVLPFPITPVGPVNDTEVDRDGASASMVDVILLNASVPSNIPDGIVVTFYSNVTDPVTGGPYTLGSNATNNSYVVLYYNPNSSSYAGNHSWWGDASSGTPNGSRTYSSYGSLQVVFMNDSSTPAQNYTHNETTTIRLNLTSVGPETRNQLNSSYAASVNFTLSSVNGVDTNTTTYLSPYWEGSYALLALAGVGVWNVSGNATANYFLDGGVSGRNFTVYGYANVTSIVISPDPIVVFQNTTVTCRAQDQHTGDALSGVQIAYILNGSSVGTSVTNATGYAQKQIAINDTGTWNVTCVFNDQLSAYYYGGDNNNLSSTVDVTAYSLGTISPVNDTIIDRDSVSSDTDNATLVAQATTWVPAGRTITFMMNLTDPLLGVTDIVLGTGVTNGSGAATLLYDPNSTTYAGNNTWWATESVATSINSSTLLIYGGFSNSYEVVGADPDDDYNRTQTLVLNATMGSQGPESQDELNASYLASLNASLQPLSTVIPFSYDGTRWNTSRVFTTSDTPGLWNATLYSLARFFYVDANTSENFTLYSWVNVTNASLSDDTIYVYETTTQTCTVKDHYNTSGVSGVVINYYRNTTFLGTNTTNASGDATLSFQTNNSGEYVVMCNVSDQLGIYYYAGPENSQNNTLTVLPFPITPVNPTNDTPVDRDGQSGAVTDVIPLNVSVPAYVPEGVLITFMSNLTDPTSSGPYILGSNTTNNSYAVLYYDPNSSSLAGNHSWYATATNGAANGSRSYLSIGGLNLSFWDNDTYPGLTITQNDTLWSRFNLTSLGPETRNELNSSYLGVVNFSLFSVNGVDSNDTSYVNPYWAGSYSLLGLAGVGVWNITGNSSADYFFGDDVTSRNFTVYGYMNVSDNIASPDTFVVYENTTSTCTVRDQHTDQNVSGAVVSFYRNTTFLGTNTTNNSGIATWSFQTNASGTYNVVCNITDQLGIYYYTGDEPERNDTITVLPFPITPTSPANNTLVDRDGASASIADVILLNVSVPGYIPDDVLITFYSNLTDPFIGGPYPLGSNNTTSSYAQLYYNPNASSYAGNFSWYAEAWNGGPNGTRTYLSYGSLQQTFTNTTDYPATNYSQNETATIQFNLTSNGPETRDELNDTYSAAVNFTVTSSNGVDTNTTAYLSPYWEGSYALLSLAGVGVWNVSGNATANYFLDTGVTNKNFTVYGYMNVTNNTLASNSVFAYEWTTDSCTVRDQHTNVNVTGAVVSFYRNGTFLGSNSTNAIGVATVSFQTNVSGTYQVRCNVSDQTGIYYLAGDEDERNDTLTVLPYPITPVSPANNTEVDRDGGSGAMTDIILLNVSVPSAIPDGVRITFISNLTDPFTGGPYALGSNTTNNSNAVLYYNPNSSSYAGNHSWYGAETSGATNGTRYFISYGSLQLAFWNTSDHPDDNYTQNESVEARLNLTTPGPETRNELNDTYGATINFTLESVVSQDTNTTTYINPYWRGLYTLLGITGVGVWNVSAQTAAPYYFGASLTGKNFTVYGFMNVSDSVLAPGSTYQYLYATQYCTVRDQHTNVNVSGVMVNFYRNSTFLGSNTTNSTGETSMSIQTNTTGNYTITCNVSDQLGIYYYAGDAPSKNDTLQVLPFPVTPTNPVNNTSVDRDSSSGSMNDSLELNVSVPGYVPDGATIYYYGMTSNPLSQGPLLLGSNTTNAQRATIYYDPNSTTYAGNWTWYAYGAPGGANGSRTFLSYGTLNLTFWNDTWYPDSNYTQNESVEARFNLTSLGPETRDDLNTSFEGEINFTVYSTNGDDTNTTTYINPYWSGPYWLSILGGVGTWNVSGTSAANYFFTSNVSARNYTVYGYMNVTNSTLSPSTHVVYRSTTQSCTVRDQHTNVAVPGATVTFYRNTTYLGTNTTNSSGEASMSFQTNNTGIYTVLCNVSDQLGIYYYAGDDSNNTDTLTVTPFPITPVNPVNNTPVDRDETNAGVADTILLNVSVPSFIPDGIPITFQANATSPITQGPVTLGTNSTQNGYAVLTYNPSSATRAGVWVWAGNSSDGYSNGSRTYDAYGTLNVTYWNDTAYPNGPYDQNTTVMLRYNLTGQGPETRNELNTSHNAIVNYTLTNTVGSRTNTTTYLAPYWEGIFSLLNLTGVGVWNVTSNSTADYFYHDGIIGKNFTVYGYANITTITLEASNVPVFENFTTSCRLQDQHTGVSVNGASIEFFLNGSSKGNATTNSTGWATISMNSTEQGLQNVSCEFITQTNIYYQAGDAPNANSTVNITPYRLSAVSPANDTRVDRDGASTDPDVVLLVAQADSTIPAGRTVTFYMNLTSPSLGYTEQALGTNTTNTSGAAVLYYNPNSTTYAGNWTWYARDVGAGIENLTRTIHVYGGLRVNFTHNNLDPRDEYNQTQTILVNATLNSRGPESMQELNDSYAWGVNSTLAPPTTAAVTLAHLVEPSYNHTASRYLSTSDEVGVWNVSLLGYATYFYNDTLAGRNFTLIGLSNLSISDESDATIKRIYQDHAFYANYSDLQNNSINYTDTQCQIRFNTTGSYGSYKNMSFNHAQDVWTYNTTFTDAGNFTFNVYCTDPFYISQNNTDFFIVNKTAINSLTPVNGTLVDRDGGNSTVDDTVQLVANVDNAIAGVEVNFTITLIDPVLGVQQNVTIGSNTTIAGGNVTLWWNPNNTVYAGMNEWGGWADQGEPNRTRTVAVYGTTNTTYYSTVHPNDEYNQTETAYFITNITSPGPESTQLLNTSYNVTQNLALTPPLGNDRTVSQTYNGSTFNGSYSFGAIDPFGVWNTSANTSGDYYFLTTTTLRNFTLFGLSTLNVSDEQDVYGYQTFSGHDAYHYANWSMLNGTPITAGACDLHLYTGTNVSLSYDATLGLWKNSVPYYLEGIASYTVNCSREYFREKNGTNNIAIQSMVNLTINQSIQNVGADEYTVILSVVNHQNYTEHDIQLYTVFRPEFTPTYSVAPIATSTVGMPDYGVSAEWFKDNLTPGSTYNIVMNVTGSGNYVVSPLMGVSSSSFNDTVYS